MHLKKGFVVVWQKKKKKQQSKCLIATKLSTSIVAKSMITLTHTEYTHKQEARNQQGAAESKTGSCCGHQLLGSGEEVSACEGGNSRKGR